MKLILQKKEKIVKEIIHFLQLTDFLIIVEYHNLTVYQLSKLRKLMSNNNAKIKIYKNNLMNLAVQNVGYLNLIPFLVGPNAFIFGNNDEIIIFKQLVTFAKKYNNLKIKVSKLNNGNILNAFDIKTIALLPTKNELLIIFSQKLLYLLNIFIFTIKAIIKNKQQLNNLKVEK